MKTGSKFFYIDLCSAHAEELIPSKNQIVQNKGTSSEGRHSHTDSGGRLNRAIFSVYNIPFVDGTIPFPGKLIKSSRSPL